MAPSAKISAGLRYLNARSNGYGHMVVHLLHGIGSQHDHVEIAVTAAFAGLEIVALRGLDRAQPGAAALTIDNQAGQLGARQ